MDELPWLQSRHAAVMRVFQSVAHTNDLEACVLALEPEDGRADAADRIEILVKYVQLFSPEFDEKVEALKSDEARLDARPGSYRS